MSKYVCLPTLSEVCDSFRLKVLLATNGFQIRNNIAELYRQNICNATIDDVAIHNVSRQFLTDTCERNGEEIYVKSFTMKILSIMSYKMMENFKKHLPTYVY